MRRLKLAIISVGAFALAAIISVACDNAPKLVEIEGDSNWSYVSGEGLSFNTHAACEWTTVLGGKAWVVRYVRGEDGEQAEMNQMLNRRKYSRVPSNATCVWYDSVAGEVSKPVKAPR